jgi:hypothetical protein
MNLYNEIASYIIAPALGIPSNDSEGPERPYSEGSKEPSQEPSKELSKESSQEPSPDLSQGPSRNTINIENPLLKLEQKRIFLSLPKSLYRYSPANKAIMTAYSSNQQIELVLAPTIMHENVFHQVLYISILAVL